MTHESARRRHRCRQHLPFGQVSGSVNPGDRRSVPYRKDPATSTELPVLRQLRKAKTASGLLLMRVLAVFSLAMSSCSYFKPRDTEPARRKKMKKFDLEKILSNIVINKSLKNNGIIIMHRHKDEKDNFLEKFKIIEERKYGISKIIFFCY